MKVYRNVYVKKWKRFPYQKLTGRNTLYYTGSIILECEGMPDGYDSKKDFYFDCDCEFSEWRNLVKK